jgi:hypothetical protein
MPELQFHKCGEDMVRIGNYTYINKHLECKQSSNVVGLQRYNRRTEQYETYNPHTEGPCAER